MDAAAAAKIDPAGVAAVLAAFAAKGVPKNEADILVTGESGWNPAAKNPIGGAVGLLQWLPSTLEHAPESPSPEAVAAMSRADQAALVSWSLRSYVRHRPGDVYLWNFVPAYLTAPESTVIFPVGSAGWRENAGFWEPNDGPITVRRVLAIGRGAEKPGRSKRPTVGGWSAWVVPTAAALGGILFLRGRRP